MDEHRRLLLSNRAWVKEKLEIYDRISLSSMETQKSRESLDWLC